MDVDTLFEQPFSPPPPGVIPNYTDPSSTGRNLIITTSVFMVIMTFFVFVRAYTKLRHGGNFTWDDLTCLLGYLLTMVYYTFCVRDVLTGYLGFHSWDVTAGQVAASDFFKIAYAQQLVTPFALLFIKLSFFILYSQIFRPLSQLRIAIWFGALITTVFYILIFAITMYFATPRAGISFFEQTTKPIEKHAIEISVPIAAIGLILDVYIITLPIYGVWQLQLSIKKKIRISLVFLTGASACISAMLTLKYRIELTRTNDILRVLVPTLITTLVEKMIGVICTCTPAFNKAFQDLLPQFETLASQLRSSFSTSKQGHLNKSYKQSSRDYERQDADQDSEAQVSYSHRMTMKKPPEDQGHELHPASSFRTFIGGGAEGFADIDSGIHKKWEVIQERADGDGTRPSTVKRTSAV